MTAIGEARTAAPGNAKVTAAEARLVAKVAALRTTVNNARAAINQAATRGNVAQARAGVARMNVAARALETLGSAYNAAQLTAARTGPNRAQAVVNAEAQRRANAARAAAEAKAAANRQKKIRKLVTNLWPLTKGNTNARTGKWLPRLRTNANIAREFAKLNRGALGEANVGNIQANINSARTAKAIGYSRLKGVNKNLNNRVAQAKWMVGHELGPAGQRVPAPWVQATLSRTAARWKGSKVRKAATNAAAAAASEAQARLAAAAATGTSRRAALLSTGSVPQQALNAAWNMWRTTKPGASLVAKAKAIKSARQGAPPTGLRFRELHDFFRSKGLPDESADYASIVFFDHAVPLTAIGQAWQGQPASWQPPAMNVGNMNKNDLKNYMMIVGGRSSVDANRIANHYFP